MITLIKQANIFAPSPLGIKDILIANGKIIAIASQLDITGITNLQVLDAQQRTVIPGFVDGHVHLIGGGGEGGFHTRTPEVQLSALASVSVARVVERLGTDGITRHNESLYAKTKALTNEGSVAKIDNSHKSPG